MMSRALHVVFLVVLVFGATLIFGSNSTLAATTHYISKSAGSDTNNGTSKSTPWAHLPGMAGATGGAASYSPVAGDQFILKGGDTWGSSDLGGVNLTYSGSSGSPIYIGVDQTWFAGASWTRPIWSCQKTNCGDNSKTFSNVVWLAGNFLTLDNIEITGYNFDNNGGNIVATYGNNITVEHLYIHGWSHASGSCGSGSQDPYAISMNWSNFAGEGTGNLFLQNIIDGSDSGDIGGDYCFGGILHGNVVQQNVIRYVYNGMNGIFNVIDGNLIEFNNDSTTGDHCNMMYPQGIFSGTTITIKNNVVRHSVCSGGTTVFTLANSSDPSYVAYLFNNVLYDNESNSDKGFSAGGPGTNGTFYFYNNTVATASGACIQNGSNGSETVHYGNFHCISGTVCNLANGTCTNDGGTLQQSAAQADADNTPHFDQYTASQTYAYSPVASTNSTAGAGTNLTGKCSGPLAGLCSDTTYATYNTTSNTVALRTTSTRSASWDIGAFQSLSSQTQGPQTPVNLQGTAQ
jgi:hypothetical protein